MSATLKSKKPAKRKFRVIQWLNTDDGTTYYGLQMKEKGRKWIHCCDGINPLLFADSSEARACAKDLRRRFSSPEN